jgi:hypothetical protein
MFHNLYSLPNIFMVGEVGVACNTNGRRRMLTGYLRENQKETDQ